MKKKQLLLTALLGALSVNGFAQKDIWLLKGDKTVATFSMEAGDYVTFHKPDLAEPEKSVTLTPGNTGKNFISYTVDAASDQYYAHGFFQDYLVDTVLKYYFSSSLDAADNSTLSQAMRMLLQYYGYTDQGTLTYKIENGMSDGQSYLYIPAGQTYYVATCNITSIDESAGVASLGDEMSVAKLTTSEAGESSETVQIEYNGQDDDGDLTYTITPSAGVKTLYTRLFKQKEYDQSVSLNGFSATYFPSADPWTADEWARYGDGQSWSTDGEDDYTMVVLGVDANGDWVKAENTQHITGVVDNCPKVNLLSKTAGAGSVSVNAEITPSNVTAAHMRLMKENDYDDAINAGSTMQELATGGDATDIREQINTYGEYTFSKSDLERGWYTLIISATDANGTNVTRANFHSHADELGSEWEILTSTFPASQDSPAARVACKVKQHKAPLAAGRPAAGTLSLRTLRLAK